MIKLPPARAATAFKHLFKANTFVSQGVEYVPDLQADGGYRVNSETAAVAPLDLAAGGAGVPGAVVTQNLIRVPPAAVSVRLYGGSHNNSIIGNFISTPTVERVPRIGETANVRLSLWSKLLHLPFPSGLIVFNFVFDRAVKAGSS